MRYKVDLEKHAVPESSILFAQTPGTVMVTYENHAKILAERTSPAESGEDGRCCSGGNFGEPHDCDKSRPVECPICKGWLSQHNEEQLRICRTSPLRVRGGTLEDFKNACVSQPSEPAGLVERMIQAAGGWNGPRVHAQMTAALAVARADFEKEIRQITDEALEWRDRLRQMTECRDDLNRLVAQREVENQQLQQKLDERDADWARALHAQHGTYLNSDVKAVFDTVWLDGLIASVRARLGRKKEPSLQERVEIEPLEITYRHNQSFDAKICGVCGATVADQLAHTGWHNNIGDAERYAKFVKVEPHE